MTHRFSGSVGRRRILEGGAGIGATAIASGILPLAIPRRAKAADTIRVLSVEDPFYFSLKAVLPDFEAETGIKVELESLSYDALQARLVSAFVANTSDADVVTVDQMWSGQYLDNGWVTPLNDFIAGDKDIDLGDFVPNVLYSSNIWRDKFVTLPVAAYAQGVLYRNDLFDSFGLDAPPVVTDDAWTWGAYVDTLMAMEGKEVDGKPLFPTVVCGAQPAPIVHMFTQIAASLDCPWFASFPQSPWDLAPQVSGDNWVAAVDLYRQLYGMSPPEAINYNWFEAGTRFSQGDIGMFYWWTPYFYLVKNNGYMTGVESTIIDKYAAAALPKAEGIDQTISLGGWSFGIPSSSDKQDEAWTFIKWATSAATQKKMALYPEYNYQFSDFARRSLYEDPEIREIYPYMDTQLALVEQGNGKVTRPPVPGYTALEGVLGLYLNQLLSAGGDTKETMQQVSLLFENVLKGNFMLPYNGESTDDTLDNAKSLIASLA